MKEIFRKWNEVSLIKRIIAGLIVGALLGAFFPNLDLIALLGTLFVSALKAVAPVLVFFLVISALANAHSDGSMKSVVLMYIISTFVSALVAVLASFLFPMTLALSEAVDQASPSGIWEVLSSVIMNVVDNPVNALVNANYIGILACGGFCLWRIGCRRRVATSYPSGLFALWHRRRYCHASRSHWFHHWRYSRFMRNGSQLFL